MKPLVLLLSILWTCQVKAQFNNIPVFGEEDTVEHVIMCNPYDIEIQISISEGLYDFSAVDGGRYFSVGNAPSFGLSYQRSMGPVLRAQLSTYYTSQEFRYSNLDSTIQIRGPLVQSKKFSYLDIIGSVVYNFQECPGIAAYFITGLGAGILVNGNKYIVGLEESNQANNPKAIFSSTGIFLIGAGMKYYFVENVGFDAKFMWRRNLSDVVRGQENSNPALRLEVGLTYAF